MDILPTIMNIIEERLPSNKIDGQDIGSLLTGTGELPEPYPFLYYSLRGVTSGIRDGNYKYVRINGEDHLFNIAVDFREKFNLIDELPGMTDELRKMIKEMYGEIEAGQREAGKL